MALHRVISDWGEGASVGGGPGGGQGSAAQSGDPTWLHSNFNSQFWATPGGDFSGTQSAVTSINNDDEVLYMWGSTSQMVADVQFWLDNQSQDFGWIIVGEEGQGRSAKRFASREHATAGSRPRLTINYTQ